MNTYETRDDVIEGKKIKVFQRNESGRIIGEYDGYYRPDKGTIVLYPAKKSYLYGTLIKHEIGVRLLRRIS